MGAFMFKRLENSGQQRDRALSRLDFWLYVFSAYAVPLCIALLSIIAFLAWDSQYFSGTPQEVEFRYVKEGPTLPLTPAAAAEAVLKKPGVLFVDTRRSEDPFWFAFETPPHSKKSSIEFPSRHAVTLQCWNEKLEAIGQADRNGTFGAISQEKAGFAMAVPDSSFANNWICKTSFVGPARLTVSLWDSAALDRSSSDFHRKAGLLDGGLIMLALFMLVTAMIVRQSRYLLFACWLVLNLRLGSLSNGWDAQWLGQAIPFEWVLRARLLTVSLYCLVTIALFAAMFKESIRKVTTIWPLQVLQAASVPLFILSATLSYQAFLPFLWAFSATTVITLVYLLVRLLIHERSGVALLYAGSLSITLLASLFEVLSAAFGLRGLTNAANSVTAALSSGLLASLAIAEQMRQEHQERLNAQAKLEHTYEAMPIGLFTMDVTGRFTSVNPALKTMLGMKAMDTTASSTGTRWSDYLDPGAFSTLLNLLYDNETAELEIDSLETHSLSHAQGQGHVQGQANVKRFLVKASLARNKVEASLQDITDKAKALKELHFLVNNDPLTKVLNRRGIEKALHEALADVDNGKPFALAYLDLDRFKLVNGLFGHSAGDEVLKQICARVAKMLSGEQKIGRIGGDEFLVIFPNTPIELATWSCRGIVTSIGAQSYVLGENAFQVRASIGLVEVSSSVSTKHIIATADRACRAAKKANQGVVVYDKSARAFHDHEAEFHIVERLSHSTGPQGLLLEMQPIMSFSNPYGTLNFEVLLRMRDEDGSIIGAGQVISAAENSGRTTIIDRWVMTTTLEWISANLASLGNTNFVCMNLSGASLNDERFLQDAVTMLEEHPDGAVRLCIEITESVALHDRGNTRRFIDKVRACGAKVALDDFGAGYTSFSYLKELPADVLKIDGSFIVNMNEHPANIAIVEAIVNLAKSLGMQTIAEWAEDAETVETLAEVGVDHVQGYAIARPALPEKILAARSAADFVPPGPLANYLRRLALGIRSIPLAGPQSK
jgi:diguanylate cyclase (GGDEF)-like protein